MEWHILRKTTTTVHLSYECADATLFAENIAIRAGDPFDVSVDLNKSLRTRHKSVGTYQDARDLADGTIDTLKMLQVSDDQVYQGIERNLARLRAIPTTFRLRVDLEGSHWFGVRPEAQGDDTLIFHVVARLDTEECENRRDTGRG